MWRCCCDGCIVWLQSFWKRSLFIGRGPTCWSVDCALWFIVVHCGALLFIFSYEFHDATWFSHCTTWFSLWCFTFCFSWFGTWGSETFSVFMVVERMVYSIAWGSGLLSFCMLEITDKNVKFHVATWNLDKGVAKWLVLAYHQWGRLLNSWRCDCIFFCFVFFQLTANGIVVKIFISGWWFGTFLIFPHIENHHPIRLIFFRGVESTNQILYCIRSIELFTDGWWRLGMSQAAKTSVDFAMFLAVCGDGLDF